MLTKIRLSNFRNFTDQVFNFSSQTTVIVADNAKGKTNILEAINLIATGRSFRARREDEMINYDAEIARVKGKVNEETLEIVLTHGFLKRGNIEEKTPKKRLLVNDTPKRLIDFASHIKSVVFRPQDIELIDDSPSVRRKFLDNLLSQVDYEYRRSLLNYEKGVVRRNKVLQSIRDTGASRSNLFFWDNLLIKNGDYISRAREEFIEYLNSMPSVTDMNFSAVYDKSAISEERLSQYSREEVYAGKTLVGPHRDEIVFKIQETSNKKQTRELYTYGSRGEQRMAVLWAKVGELEYIKEKTNEKPILLLDDIFSELDHEHREVIEQIVKDYQTVITSPDPHFIESIEAQEIIRL